MGRVIDFPGVTSPAEPAPKIPPGPKSEHPCVICGSRIDWDGFTCCERCKVSMHEVCYYGRVRLNERLTIQKGVFLGEMPSISGLLYDANVTEATLFPGIDGFARSLQNSVSFLKLDGMSPTSI